MNDAEISKQVQQMVCFIKQEVEEKANEITVSAEEEFNIEKVQIVEAEKRKIKQEYERKEKQLDIRKRIDYSIQLIASQLKVLQTQDDLVQGMKNAAEQQLATISETHHEYRVLLKELIVQALLRLKDSSVLLRCRESDVDLVFNVLDDAKNEYIEKLGIYGRRIFFSQTLHDAIVKY
ncbi:hypothetical protein KP509_14G002500 [Ceratopteris richardii]|uniref:V-type proton ATPase subunit E n=1 Tax=Ceratopteris richardii TaxID=49495 RepID=A0A8T2T581_CERRI|nr:hypothetical protein KP509_14G002500 [Ceratopteris richardii]